MEESVFISKILNDFSGDDYLMVEKLLNLRSESLAKQFKDDVSCVLRSNNLKSVGVYCNNDSGSKTAEIKRSKVNDCGSLKFSMLESKNHEVAACKPDQRVGKMILKIRKSDLMARVDFGNVGTKTHEAASEKCLSGEGFEKKHNHEIASCRPDESVGKRVIKIRTNDRSMGVDFDNVGTKTHEAAAEKCLSGEGSEKKHYHEVAACRRDESVGKGIIKIRPNDRSLRVDFGNVGTKTHEAAPEKCLSGEGSEKKHNHEVAACRRDESVGKGIIKIRTGDHRSLRVDFGNVDMKNHEAAAEGTSSDEGSKKEMKKRKAKDERSSKPSKKHKNLGNNDNVNDQIEEEYPELPLAFKEKIEEMEGSEVKLVIQKELTASDVDKSKSRFSIPIKKMIKDCKFLRLEEESSLDYVRQKKTDGKKLDGFLVSVLDPNLILHDGICFKKWKMAKNTEIYNLTKKWNDLVAKNLFKENEKVQLWSFRSHQKLYFALVKLQPRSINQ
ncbi:uncharacterized protein LOC123920556 [Trifolium pratense]|uniref:uncharacterized protein LOC123920556 n=1 Tax=Trifolium pratense TaxID=57577 RepID=UPI001E692BCE|nr:uncharacterized protein LOC123920556 [Trifolium pratense]